MQMVINSVVYVWIVAMVNGYYLPPVGRYSESVTH